MKKPTKHDLSILAVSLFIGIVLGWAIKALYDSTKSPLTIENPVNTALIKRNDSLEAVVVQRDIQDSIKAKKEALSDSIVNKNHKILDKYYDKLKDLDVDVRLSKYDSILANYKVRR